nr:DNA primase [Sphingomonas jejuensis]
MDEVRARTTLSTLVGRSTKLQRAGNEWKACCPFHQEKSPSFYVNDQKGFYHCFGCGAHGDAIRWLTEQQGLSFIDAVKDLAQAAGLDMPAPDPEVARRMEAQSGLHDVMAAAAEWFRAQFRESREARAYAERRGLSAATLDAFAIGYAPDGRTRLKEALSRFDESLLVEAGLLIRVEGKAPYDRFRDRLMIPIRDPRGRVIAFGGRVIGDGEPKYLNSPETPLFDKGRTLFNLDKAATAARKAGRLIVVEGYLDVIALHQAGVPEAVAPLGTALTEGQMERMWRIVDTPVVCFDGDAAGRKAAARAAHRALPRLEPGLSLSFVALPPGQDPDDLVRDGGKPAFDAVVEATEPLVDRLWRDMVDAQPLDTPERRAGLRRRLSGVVAEIADRDVRAQYDHHLRERFEDSFLLRRARPRGGDGTWRRGSAFLPPRPLSGQARSIGSTGIDHLIVKAIIAGLLRFPETLPDHLEALGSLSVADQPLGRLMDALVDLALAEHALDPERLTTILAATEYNALARDLLRADTLPFSFARSGGDPDRAKADLGEAIRILAWRPEVDEQLKAATERLKAGFDEALFAEQQRLLVLRVEVERRLADLVQGDDDADGQPFG